LHLDDGELLSGQLCRVAAKGRLAPVRLATFNILHGRSVADGRVDVERFADAIAALDADILALQEVDRDQPRSFGADLTAVAADAMGAVESRFVAAISGTPGSDWQAATGREPPGTPVYGVALLSRYPVGDWKVVRLPMLPIPVPFRHYDQKRPHLVRDEPRVAVLATVQTPSGALLVAATHLSFLPGWNAVQLRRVARAIADPGGPAVVLGDLNMSPELAHRVTRLEPLAAGLTFPADQPRRQIDHILGRDLPTTGMTATVRTPLSDHQALIVDLPEAPA
jgi:endonuclease/exonuclease/phosphatase family metal-dependent hydrolase